jgi:hypothetical protein
MSSYDLLFQKVFCRRPVLWPSQGEVKGPLPVLLDLPGNLRKKDPAAQLGEEGPVSQFGGVC